MRFMFAALLWLITFSIVDVASAETPDELTEIRLTKACAKGYAMGCANLGLAYNEGTGVKQDSFKAVELSRKSCDGQEEKGCANLGLAYLEGEGVKQDSVKGVAIFRQTCDGLKSAAACELLGHMYAAGNGVRQSVEDALTFYGKACDLKGKIGCENYARLKTGKK